MICIVDDNNIIVNIVNTNDMTASNRRKYYDWNRIGQIYTDIKPLEYARREKLSALKTTRDDTEVLPITYQGYSFDYDSKARERINAAIIALESAGTAATFTWTTADNKDVKVTAANLRGVIAQVALRSDKLHTAYRKAKAKVEAATSEEEVDAVELE